MRLSHDELEVVKEKDRKSLGVVEKDVNTIRAIKSDEVEKEYGSITRRIAELQEEKHKVYRIPMTKEAFLGTALEDLRIKKKDAITQALKSIFEVALTGRTAPIDIRHLTLAFDGHRLGNLAVLAISEEDVKELVSTLPDGGIEEKARAKRISEIETEIQQLTEKLKGDVSTLKSQKK